MSERTDSGLAREAPVRSNHKVLFKSDGSCFPSYADAKNDFRPECHLCGKPARGASFVSMQDHSLLGRTVGVVEFSCGCDGRTSFAITADNLFPSWRLLTEQSPGIWSVAHLSQEQKANRCSPAN